MVDSNVILDIATQDSTWYGWSSEMISSLVETQILVINPIIYTEVSIGYVRIEEVEKVLTPEYFQRENIPWEACFLAGKCFLEYRRRGGSRSSPLPDFFIGAHASIRGYSLLTRDHARYHHPACRGPETLLRQTKAGIAQR